MPAGWLDFRILNHTEAVTRWNALVVNNLFRSRDGGNFSLLFIFRRRKSCRLRNEKTRGWEMRTAWVLPYVCIQSCHISKTSHRSAFVHISSSSFVDLFSSQTAESPVSPEPSPPPSLTPEPESGVDGQTMNSEECYFCGQRVYVLERISAEGRFFHRSCFGCHQCGIRLRLGGYTFDEATGEDATARVSTLPLHTYTIAHLSFIIITTWYCHFFSEISKYDTLTYPLMFFRFTKRTQKQKKNWEFTSSPSLQRPARYL